MGSAWTLPLDAVWKDAARKNEEALLRPLFPPGFLRGLTVMCSGHSLQTAKGAHHRRMAAVLTRRVRGRPIS